MSEKRKKSRWEKTLDEAGLLDEVGDGWTLPDGPVQGSTICVPGSGDEQEALSASAGTDRDPGSGEGDKEGESGDEGDEDLGRTPLDPKQFSEDDPIFTRTTPVQMVEAASRQDMAMSEDPADEDADDGDPDEARTANVHGVKVSAGARPATADLAAEIGKILDRPIGTSDAPEGSVPLVKAFSKEEIPERRAEMSAQFEIGDFTSALDTAEKILEHFPDDGEALSYRKKCRETLLEMYESHIGSFDHVPVLAISDQEVVWRDLDPRDSFVLSRIDGQLTFQDILDVSGLSRFETCRILDNLLQNGIIK